MRETHFVPKATRDAVRRPHLRDRLTHPLHLPFRLWADNLAHRPLELLALAALVLGLAGATLFWFGERGLPASTLHSWWDGLWLTVTSINENYGDVYPMASATRVVAFFVAVLGVLLVGSFTAVVTNYMLGDEHKQFLAALEEINARLERIEDRLGDGKGG